ncbi:MAG TPA: DUF3375 domain-containing protein [Elusimicrobiota bacterium]|nr:DUF3375 domain-containing protein [Elusimicrobiota bacterium]
MDHDYLERLRKHPAWRLLNADTAPLIISFLDNAFLKPNARSYTQSQLVSKLEDHLFKLNEALGDRYPRPAQEYLDDWVRGENAYLRKYYSNKQEPEFDLIPATEKAIEWLRSLEQKSFVGTESRLLTIFELLRQVTQGAERDRSARIVLLEKRRAAIDEDIKGLRAGDEVLYDATKIKEQYLQIEDAARRLLADFRQVEENFRQLDRRTREKIATSEQSKGRLLDEIFGEESAITVSDEGRSFRAFWEFLMSPERQQELQEMAAKLATLDEVKTLASDDLLVDFKYRLMDAGEKIRKTTSSLVEHLRRFIEGRAWLENKRIMEIIQTIEKRAIELQGAVPKGAQFVDLEDVRPSLDLTMDRGLFDPAKNKKAVFENTEVTEGVGHFETDALYEIQFIDERELRGRIDQALENSSQVTLEEICARHPLGKGLAELLTYINIAAKDGSAIIEEESRYNVTWRDSEGREKRATIPRVIFVRELTTHDA